MIIPRYTVYNGSPPERRTRLENNPTLLFSWWCTIMSLTIIGFRISGRFIRNERLFREDKIMALSIIPLLARMACVHVVLIWGTNNVDVTGLTDPRVIQHRATGAKLVLCARIFYAMFIWTAKLTVSEFLKRMTERFWKKGYDVGLRAIRIFLLATFIAVVIATLAECQPFHHYWQVVPDPGPQCRQGYAHLFTMGITDIISDILLISFPIPIILKSGMPIKRKLSLITLFSMSIILIGITGARIPLVVNHRGLQQFRSVFASGEILAAAAVSNAIILGSFLRDRGVKKQKFKFGSATDSMDRRSSTRRHTLQQWGSDEDLFRQMGIRCKLENAEQVRRAPRPAPVADLDLLSPQRNLSNSDWQFPTTSKSITSQLSDESDLRPPAPEDPLPSPKAGRRVSFYDVGGLLEAGSRSTTSVSSPTDSVIAVHDFAGVAPPRRTSRASNGRVHTLPARRSSRLSQQSEEIEMTVRPTQQLQDAGGLLSESDETAIEEESTSPSTHTSISNNHTRPSNGHIHRTATETSYDVPSIQDPGGLLS